MKFWLTAFLRLCWGAYFILASLYCFMAYAPFTYLFVIVNPPYPWISSFAKFNLLFLWVAVIGSTAPWLARRAVTIVSLVAVFTQVLFALTLSFLNPLAHIQSGRPALIWSILFVLPVVFVSVHDFMRRIVASRGTVPADSIAYSDAVYIGVLLGLIPLAPTKLYAAWHGGALPVTRHDAELMLWAIVEHIALAILIASVINLIRLLLVRRTKNAFLSGPGVVALVSLAGLALGCLSFVEDSMSLRGWAVGVYSVLFAAAVISLVFSVLAPALERSAGDEQPSNSGWLRSAIAMFLVLLSLGTLAAIEPSDDWNSLVHQTFAIVIWFALAFVICEVRSLQKEYSLTVVLIVTLLTCGAYEGLNHSKSLWAADLGPNQVQIARELRNYSALNSSFGLVDRILGNQPGEPCDFDCKALRQYTNLRHVGLRSDINLVDHLAPTQGEKPNIFIIVMDSLRPDYIGAYNPKVDFTPNIDKFARDSVVMRRAYTNYAGTSLSEPSIWSGALLLHEHYAQPFQKVNNLEKLARADGYEIVLTYDAILREVIPASEPMVKLDMDKKFWQQVEISSTVQQLEEYLAHRGFSAPPVLFYSQPMNVQVHADNSLPKRTKDNWRERPGFDNRIAYALHQADGSLGSFFAYLKEKNLYDNSIIILTADHGDATGELGRLSHSTIIYPEVMRVPLIFHVPQSLAGRYAYDTNRISTLIDIAPSLYYLLGHGAVRANPLFGRSMFVENKEQLRDDPRGDNLFLASDSIAAYGILAGDGRWMYTIYDSPSRSMLFDLAEDPTAQRNIVTPELKKKYNERIFQYLRQISNLYGYQPTGG